jgi:hypothetical protein
MPIRVFRPTVYFQKNANIREESEMRSIGADRRHIGYLTLEEIAHIIEHYNNHKLPNESCLEYLQCKEGGFILHITPTELRQKYKYYNCKHIPVKQIRWNQNILASYFNYPGFTQQEEFRLFQSISSVLEKQDVGEGTENRSIVQYFETFSDIFLEKKKSRCESEDDIGISETWRYVNHDICKRMVGMAGIAGILSEYRKYEDILCIWSVPRVRL